MNTWFANLSVTRKLALGFGLVLALTLALAWTAWSGLGSVIKRSTWMIEITQLNATLTNLRIARLQFMLAKGDAASTGCDAGCRDAGGGGRRLGSGGTHVGKRRWRRYEWRWRRRRRDL